MSARFSRFPWNGCKEWALHHLAPFISAWGQSTTDSARYIEPFLGSASISRYTRSILPNRVQVVSDINPWLMAVHKWREPIIPRADELTMEAIYQWRALMDLDAVELCERDRALRFLVCLHTSWGHRWEVLPDGTFRSTLLKEWCSPEYLMKVIPKSSGFPWLALSDSATCNSWKTVAEAKEGDLVVLDPPYPDVLGYGPGIWSMDAWADLYFTAQDLASRGTYVIGLQPITLQRLWAHAGFSVMPIHPPKRGKTSAPRVESIVSSFQSMG